MPLPLPGRNLANDLARRASLPRVPGAEALLSAYSAVDSPAALALAAKTPLRDGLTARFIQSLTTNSLRCPWPLHSAASWTCVWPGQRSHPSAALRTRTWSRHPDSGRLHLTPCRSLTRLRYHHHRQTWDSPVQSEVIPHSRRGF